MRMLSGGSIAALAMCVFGVAFPADAQTDVIYACAGPNGQLRIVGDAAACRPSETSLSWNAEGQQGPDGAPGLQGDPGPAGSGRKIVDAAGGVIGDLFGSSQGASALVQADAANLLALPVTTTTFMAAGPPQARWLTNDCSGPIYFPVPSPTPLINNSWVLVNAAGAIINAATGAGGVAVIYADYAATPETQSSWQRSFGTGPCAPALSAPLLPSKTWTIPAQTPYRIE
jgi:hypothetical protein